MEYHFVPAEERAKDEKGNLLPWGYVYKEFGDPPHPQDRTTDISQPIPQPAPASRRIRPIRQAQKRPIRPCAIAHPDGDPSPEREPQRSGVRAAVRSAARDGESTGRRESTEIVIVVWPRQLAEAEGERRHGMHDLRIQEQGV